MVVMDREILKRNAFFSGLPDEQLDHLLGSGERIYLEAGEILMAEGSLPDAFYVVLEGEVEILKRAGNREVVIAVNGPCSILGEMSLIEDAPRTASVQAPRPCKVLKISRETFNDLVFRNPTVAVALLRTVMKRLRETEGMLSQQEKLASLGTLAAGLAHELNNPAAAASRSAGHLRQTISEWLNARSSLDALHLETSLNDKVLNRLREDIARNAQDSLALDPLEHSDREYEIESWLEAHGVDEAWEYAPLLVSFGWQVPALIDWCASFDAKDIPAILCWLATGYEVHSLLGEINNSTERITEIVSAVKDYTYLDQAPLKRIDLHTGLESTLVILKHKLRQGITVKRDYDRGLPLIEAYGSELNQVWTNLIDNAIEAMQGQGELRLRTYREGAQAAVEICDSGPGIPQDVLPRLFEPFFTTKEPGKGTGLGLNVSYNIIQKHRGKIEVSSKPGDTRFLVRLPLQ
jgi:signal transduction histidine kinase